MTDKLPLLFRKEVVKDSEKLGYSVNDQKGSHIQIRHPVRRPLMRSQSPGNCQEGYPPDFPTGPACTRC